MTSNGNEKWTKFHNSQQQEVSNEQSEKGVLNSETLIKSTMPDLSQFMPGDKLLQLDPASK